MIQVRAVALATGIFFAVTYTLCVAVHLVVPPSAFANEFWSSALPGFRWISPGSFVLGLGEVFLYGLYTGGFLSYLYNVLTSGRRSMASGSDASSTMRRVA